MYQIHNDEEFEPRVTPKPASKLDCFAVSMVPEVSLVFDKPIICKTADRVGFHSSSVESKGSSQKKNVASPLNANGSYAAWREQNYAWKSPPSRVANCTPPQKVQSNYNCTQQSCFPEDTNVDALRRPREKDYASQKDFYNSPKYEGRRTHRTNANNSCNPQYQMYEDNSAHIKKAQRTKSQYDNRIRQIDSACTASRKNIDNYIPNERQYSPTYERKLVIHNREQQKASGNDSVYDPTVQNVPINPNTLKGNEFQVPHYLGQQYPYFNVNTYPFPQLPHYSNHNTDSQETVKNFLQIINSQNEQIKSLQIQVDRLLKMQEESIKERKRCSCSSQLQEQNEQFTESNNTVGIPNYVTVPQNVKKNMYQRESPRDKKKEHFNENDRLIQNEAVLTEAQSKKAFMEQKVSIGVMTSFEFTVQNSPFTVDVEDYETTDNQQRTENLKVCNGVGLRDTNDSLRRYKNSFTRMPSAQLENIVEDSESYMSSSQQQSSNLNASVSMKDLEKQAYMDSRKESDTHRSESPKLCKGVTKRLNQTEDNTQKYLNRICSEEMKNCETVKTPVINKRTVEYEVPPNSNRKTNIPVNTNEHTRKNMQRDTDSAKSSNSENSSNDYYKDHRRDGQTVAVKRTNCVEDSLILNGGDLKINERPPTPEPSIHVDMHEYSSDDDSEKVKRSSKVGWTFYNNVLGQVNQLLHNSGVIDDQQQNQAKENHQNDRDETENKAVLDTVKVATLEQLKKLGISLSDNTERKDINSSNKMAFDLSFYPRLDYQTNVTNTTSAVNETNTSMHMKALALKYLSDDQLAELAVQRQGSTSVKHLMVSNVQGTNMSFATMRYLERYQLLPGKNNVQTEDIGKLQTETPQKTDLKFANPKSSPTIQRFPFSRTPRTTCPSKILDISTLKQQPKLL